MGTTWMCHLLMVFIMLLSITENIDAATRVRRRYYMCPPDFIRVGNSCYFFSKVQAPWQEANFECKDRNSTLAEPKTQHLDKQLRDYINESKLNPVERWIGGFYNWLENQWRWGVSGEEMHYNSFYRNQDPRRNQTGESLQWHCSTMDPWVENRWSADLCIVGKHYICETPLETMDSAARDDYQKKHTHRANEIEVPETPEHAYQNPRPAKPHKHHPKKHRPNGVNVHRDPEQVPYGYEDEMRRRHHREEQERRRLHHQRLLENQERRRLANERPTVEAQRPTEETLQREQHEREQRRRLHEQRLLQEAERRRIETTTESRSQSEDEERRRLHHQRLREDEERRRLEDERRHVEEKKRREEQEERRRVHHQKLLEEEQRRLYQQEELRRREPNEPDQQTEHPDLNTRVDEVQQVREEEERRRHHAQQLDELRRRKHPNRVEDHEQHEESVRRKQEETRRQQEDAMRQEEETRRQEEETRRQEEESRRQEKARRQQEEERRHQEEERRRREEARIQHLENERRRQETTETPSNSVEENEIPIYPPNISDEDQKHLLKQRLLEEEEKRRLQKHEERIRKRQKEIEEQRRQKELQEQRYRDYMEYLSSTTPSLSDDQDNIIPVSVEISSRRPQSDDITIYNRPDYSTTVSPRRHDQEQSTIRQPDDVSRYYRPEYTTTTVSPHRYGQEQSTHYQHASPSTTISPRRYDQEQSTIRQPDDVSRYYRPEHTTTTVSPHRYGQEQSTHYPYAPPSTTVSPHRRPHQRPDDRTRYRPDSIIVRPTDDTRLYQPRLRPTLAPGERRKLTPKQWRERQRLRQMRRERKLTPEQLERVRKIRKLKRDRKRAEEAWRRKQHQLAHRMERDARRKDNINQKLSANEDKKPDLNEVQKAEKSALRVRKPHSVEAIQEKSIKIKSRDAETVTEVHYYA